MPRWSDNISETEIREIFERNKERLLAGTEPSAGPVAFVLGGQPASGKTSLANRCERMYPDRKFLVINGDLYRAFHPYYEEIIRKDPARFSGRTQPFSNIFTEGLIREAASRRLNIIVEGTMRNPDVPSRTIRMFKDAGFTVEAAVVAAPGEFTTIYAVHRYQEQVLRTGHGRFPDMASHDAAVTGLLGSVDRIVDEAVADRLHVFSFSPVALLKTYTNDGMGFVEPGWPSDLISEERRLQLDDPARLAAVSRKAGATWQALEPRFRRFMEDAMMEVERRRVELADKKPESIPDAYLDRESAVLWLGRHLDAHGYDIKARYHLEITNKLINNGTEILKRFPQEVFGGLPEGGRRNVQATLLCRTGDRPGGAPEKGRSQEERAESLERLIRTWAEKEGLWVRSPEQTLGGRYTFIGDGGEAKVYYDGSDGRRTVVKLISTAYFADVQEALDRITIHNALFPQSAMTVEGFGRNSEGLFSFVVRQPFIEGGTISEDDLHFLAGKLGMFRIERLIAGTEYCNDTIYLGDLHDENVLKDPFGYIHVIDCDARLNTPSLGLGGRWTVPEVDGSEASVAEIDRFLDGIVPKRASRDRFTEAFSPQDPSLSEQLALTGRYDGVLRARDDGGGTVEIAVHVDPDDPGKVLYMDRRGIVPMTEGCPVPEKELGEIRCGRCIRHAGETVAFDPASGTVARAEPYGRALRRRLHEDEKRKTDGKLRNEKKASRSPGRYQN